jgi:hypothetical protein
VDKLIAIEESPWGDLRGKPLDARGLAHRLKAFEIAPHTIRIVSETPKGYEAADFADAWARYLPSLPSHEPQRPQHPQRGGSDPPHATPWATPTPAATSVVALVSHVADHREGAVDVAPSASTSRNATATTVPPGLPGATPGGTGENSGYQRPTVGEVRQSIAAWPPLGDLATCPSTNDSGWPRLFPRDDCPATPPTEGPEEVGTWTL